MTQRWIKYISDPTGYKSVKEVQKRLGMGDHQIYRLLAYEQVELVQYQHQDYLHEAALSRLEDPNELGDPHQAMWSLVILNLADPFDDYPPCPLENLKARIAANAIQVGAIFEHEITRKRVRYNGQELENLGVARE